MPIDKLQREVAAIALRVAAGHGFALAGGNALIAHGIIDRPTDDVDLFSDEQGGVEAAAEAVGAALRGAGFLAERRDKPGGLGDIFEGMGEGLAEWLITAPGGQQTMLQMAYFDRCRGPVIMDVGPVLDLEDLAVESGRAGQPGGAARLRRYGRGAGALHRSPADRPGQAAGSGAGGTRLRRRRAGSWTGCRTASSAATGSARRTSPGSGTGSRPGPAADRDSRPAARNRFGPAPPAR